MITDEEHKKKLKTTQTQDNSYLRPHRLGFGVGNSRMHSSWNVNGMKLGSSAKSRWESTARKEGTNQSAPQRISSTPTAVQDLPSVPIRFQRILVMCPPHDKNPEPQSADPIRMSVPAVMNTRFSPESVHRLLAPSITLSSCSRRYSGYYRKHQIGHTLRVQALLYLSRSLTRVSPSGATLRRWCFFFPATSLITQVVNSKQKDRNSPSSMPLWSLTNPCIHSTLQQVGNNGDIDERYSYGSSSPSHVYWNYNQESIIASPV